MFLKKDIKKKTVGIPNFFDKITRVMDWHLLNIFSRSTCYIYAWPTKYTAVYVTIEGQKLRGQFSENVVLRIYESLFNSGGNISKEKRIMKVLRIKN